MTIAQQRLYGSAIRLFAEKGTAAVTVSELALAAGISRGTIYNHFDSVERLFESVAARLGKEMSERIVASFPPGIDAAQRLANGIRQFIRRAHEEPDWGRFVCRFSLGRSASQGLRKSAPTQDVMLGLRSGLYTLEPAQIPSALAMVTGSTIAAMTLVLEGHRTWRDAGSDTAEFVLRALGLDETDARTRATVPLSPLPALGPGVDE